MLFLFSLLLHPPCQFTGDCLRAGRLAHYLSDAEQEGQADPGQRQAERPE